MGEWTGEGRWDEAARESAIALRERRGGDGLWRQDDDYRGLSTLHGVAGNTLALLRFEADAAVASESAAVLSRHAFCEDGLADWPGSPRSQLTRPQTAGSVSSGAPARRVSSPVPGSISTRTSCSPAPSSSGVRARTATRRPRPLPRHLGQRLRPPQGVARTGDEHWLERARRFAVHALAQAERIAAANGDRRYSLFNGTSAPPSSRRVPRRRSSLPNRRRM